MNIAISGPEGSRWAMTERGSKHINTTTTSLDIGPSSLQWIDGVLVAKIVERGVPLPRAVRGEIRVVPSSLTTIGFHLDKNQNHHWHPIAPHCQVEVNLTEPDWNWSGTGYLDCNRGSEPLEDAFSGWQWSRAHVDDKTTIFYESEPRGGQRRSIALDVGSEGQMALAAIPASQSLRTTKWGIQRQIACDDDAKASVETTWESGPFYVRSLARSRWNGRDISAVHESLSLDRFRQRWVQAMLPFRMPRALR